MPTREDTPLRDCTGVSRQRALLAWLLRRHPGRYRQCLGYWLPLVANTQDTAVLPAGIRAIPPLRLPTGSKPREAAPGRFHGSPSAALYFQRLSSGRLPECPPTPIRHQVPSRAIGSCRRCRSIDHRISVKPFRAAARLICIERHRLRLGAGGRGRDHLSRPLRPLRVRGWLSPAPRRPPPNPIAPGGVAPSATLRAGITSALVHIIGQKRGAPLPLRAPPTLLSDNANNRISYGNQRSFLRGASATHPPTTPKCLSAPLNNPKYS